MFEVGSREIFLSIHTNIETADKQPRGIVGCWTKTLYNLPQTGSAFRLVAK